MPYRLTITAELNNWCLDAENNSIVGVIHNSNDSTLPDGLHYYILNFRSMTHYPAFKIDTLDQEEHWLVLTAAGRYFVLYKSQMQ